MRHVSEMVARVSRLNALAAGLSKEILQWQEDMGPLLYMERLAYLTALHKAIAGLEDARVVLVKALDRISREEEAMRTGGCGEMKPA